ncbi:hypothetical protein M2138_001991 [Dysgonomonadaceae bacterium PH5-43]|nr:hypothetical protein [Dysgonomonadaceae bacterium PH5-43]
MCVIFYKGKKLIVKKKRMDEVDKMDENISPLKFTTCLFVSFA